MDNSKLLKLVIEQLSESVNDEDVVDAWNEICSEDDKVYPMSDFNEVCDVFNYDSPKEIIDRVREYFDRFYTNDEWFYIDCGEYHSTDNPFDVIDKDELAQHIIDGEVECGGIDVEELKKECGELRPFKTKEEFKQETGLSIGSQLIMRSKDSGAVVEAAITSFSTLNSRTVVCIGITAHNLDELFNIWEYQKDNEWKPFGIADTEEKTTDAGSATSKE